FGNVPCPCGAGPFEIEAYSPGISATLVRNPHYWGPKPYLNSIRFVLPPSDPTLVIPDVQTGQFDAALQSAAQVVRTAKADKLVALTERVNLGQTIVFNSFSGPAANPLVRQAVTDAINPVFINNRVYAGAETISPCIAGRGSTFKVTGTCQKYN